jgi:ferredoxin-NADP reductase
VLLSAGIGATPVLAMLYALAAARSTQQVLWLHAARDREHHPFAAEVRASYSRSRTVAAMSVTASQARVTR